MAELLFFAPVADLGQCASSMKKTFNGAEAAHVRHLAFSLVTGAKHEEEIVQAAEIALNGEQKSEERSAVFTAPVLKKGETEAVAD
ncbi:Hypothetical protein NTJ_02016 [Nesidiocoris tenuis]|uniref:Serpin domain-containing protein n=1 Tax=Nesidiocoris tenuis TaxID=355587 RepID=A0ABN7AEB6_9HEMI|nr:Hypothetical protein NTJ_02016 [Nesidiocoris tenuis]